VRQQPGAWFGAKGLEVERGPLRIRLCGAQHVDARDEAADPLEHIVVVQVRRAAAAAVEQRHAMAVDVMQRAAIDRARRHRRHLGRDQFRHERMLFFDLRIAPAARPIELGDDEAGAAVGVFHAHLEHAVLVAVERQQRAGGEQTRRPADRVDRVEHGIRREVGVGR
jgi:hypothetical protein